ncbi:MAG: MTH1187 family thiamine-binding protein [Calditrichaeota bacterium]|nr:MTH1187 family thiamine-binding protein [Calditrichota bacterium]
MAIVAISVAPLGEGTSISKYVAAAERVLREDGRVKFRLDPMFTTIQGNLDICLEVAQKMHEAVFAAGAQRVSTVIKIDDRRDKPVDMDDKIRSVEEELNR